MAGFEAAFQRTDGEKFLYMCPAGARNELKRAQKSSKVL